MNEQDVECAACGFALGLGIPGSKEWCSDCGRYMIAKAERGDADAIIGAGIALGVGLLAAYALSRVFSDRR